MNKFDESNLKGRTVMKVEDFKPCKVCGDNTDYIDYLLGSRYCSHECYDNSMEAMSKWARGETDTIEY